MVKCENWKRMFWFHLSKISFMETAKHMLLNALQKCCLDNINYYPFNHKKSNFVCKVAPMKKRKIPKIEFGYKCTNGYKNNHSVLLLSGKLEKEIRFCLFSIRILWFAKWQDFLLQIFQTEQTVNRKKSGVRPVPSKAT